MIALLLIVIPLLAGIISCFIKNEASAKGITLLSSFLTLAIAIAGVYASNTTQIHWDGTWLSEMGSRFTLTLDGMSKMLCLLNAIALPLVIISTYKNQYNHSGSFYGLLLLMQCGMMGVFLAADALLFYFFWELALIPTYFLCSIWGGERRIAVTFKFFVYTFLGSLFMLIGILYLYFQTAGVVILFLFIRFIA